MGSPARIPRRARGDRRSGRRCRLGGAALAAVLVVAAPAAAADFWLPPDIAYNNPLVAVAFGDSITDGQFDGGFLASPYPMTLQGLLAPQFPGFVVVNAGQGGEKTDDGLARLGGVLAFERPLFVLIMEGTNDASGNFDPDVIVANLRAMVRLAKASFTIPLLGAIPPNFRDDPDAHAVIDAVNAQLPAVAAEEGVRFVNTFAALDNPDLYGPDDFLHPNQDGHDVLATTWAPALTDAVNASQALLGGVTVAGGHLGGAMGELQIVAGFGPGRPPSARAFRPDNTAFAAPVTLYPGFLGGVRTAACDLDNDGRAEMVAGPGPGGGPHVLAIKVDPACVPTGPPLASFFAFGPAFAGGTFVACGDLDGDNVASEIVVGAGRGGGPHVRAFRYQPGEPTGVVPLDVSFFAYDAGFAGGVEVAVGDLDGDGAAEIITGAGAGGGPHVRAFLYAPAAPGGVVDFGLSFFAYDAAFTGGVHVAAGDLDGNATAELVTGAGRGGGPHVRVFRREPDGSLTELAGFYAYVPEFTGGAFVGVAGGQVLTGAGPGGGPHVRGFTAAGVPTSTSFFAE